SMRYQDPRPCSIPEVGYFSSTRQASRSAPLVSYFHEDVRRGTLHFADTTCKTFPLTFDDARVPVAETEKSVVVWAGSELWLATPDTGDRERLAEGVTDVIRSGVGHSYVVRAEGRLSVFDANWKPHETFGNDVSSVLRAGQSLFYIDADGAHRLFPSESDP